MGDFREDIKNLDNFSNEPVAKKPETIEVNKDLVFESEYVLKDYIVSMENYIKTLTTDGRADENVLSLMRGKLNELKSIHAKMKIVTDKETERASTESAKNNRLGEIFK